MRPFKVNADYEVSLFSGKNSPEIVNHSLEFLYWFLESAPLFTTKSYHPEYLRYIEEIVGQKPRSVTSGCFENWWGSLTNLSLERELNSKITSANLCDESQIISDVSELKLEGDRSYLAKNPAGMSGLGFVTFTRDDLTGVIRLLSASGRIIVEPLFDRVYDFSHYLLSDRTICYENLVDRNFQYKGTLFSSLRRPDVSSLTFAKRVPPQEWQNFQTRFEVIRCHYEALGAGFGYSVDSFVYRDGQELKIRALSEINYRRTMGLVAYQLSQRFARKMDSSLFVLCSGPKTKDTFAMIRNSIREIAWSVNSGQGVLQLSPGDTRFECFLICGESVAEVRIFYDRLRTLLPDCKFAVNI